MNAIIEQENALEIETKQIIKINSELDEQYFVLWKAKNKIEEEMKEIKEKITKNLGEKSAVGIKIQCVWVAPSLTFDSVKLKKESPELYAKYVKNKLGFHVIKVNGKEG